MRKTAYKAIAIAMFAGSAVITIMYTMSNVTGFIATIIALIQGAGIEGAKSFFSYNAVISPSWGKRIIFGSLALVAFIISVVATTGFSINMSNSVKNESIYNSAEYAQHQDYLAKQQDLYNQTKKSIDDSKVQRDSQISGMAKVRDAWGANYKTAKSLEQDKINSYTAKTDSNIAAKEGELNKIAETLQDTATTSTIKQVEGYEALYNVVAKYLNKKTQARDKAATTTDDVAFYINFIISVSLEFFGIGFIYLAEQTDSKIVTSKPAIVADKQIGFKPQIAASSADIVKGFSDDTICSYSGHIPVKNKIGFAAETMSLTNVPSEQDIQQTDLAAYINYMYDNAKEGNVSVGYCAIGKAVGIKQETCRKIRGFLERHGVITVYGNSTLILKPKNECNFKL